MVSSIDTFKLMRDNPFALDRLDLKFLWGEYFIRILKFHLMTYPAGTIVAPHKHSGVEFHYVLKGKGILRQENHAFPLHEGMVYVVNPDAVHYQELMEEEPLEELILHIEMTKVDELTRTSKQWNEYYEAADAAGMYERIGKFDIAPVLDRHNTKSCFISAYGEWHKYEYALFTSLKLQIIQIMIRSARNFDTPEQSGSLPFPARDMKTYSLEMATQYIHANYNQPLSLDEIAASIRLSGRQLQRVFRELTGETFSEYVERFRLSRVCNDLAYSELKVEAIALLHGFSNSTYMHYVFKRRLGLTPAKYRKNAKKLQILTKQPSPNPFEALGETPVSFRSSFLQKSITIVEEQPWG